MANIARIELGDTTYEDDSIRSAIEAITDYDAEDNIYVKTSQLKVEGTSTLTGDITTEGNIDADGNITVTSGHNFRAKINSIDYTVNPSAEKSSNTYEVFDANDVRISQIRTLQESDGRIGTALIARRGVSTTDGIKANAFYVWVASNGTPTYQVSNPAAFRTAIDAQVAGDYVTRSGVSNAWIQNYNGTDQHWGVGATVANANNSTYKNHNTTMITRDKDVALFDGTTQSWLWSAYTTQHKPTPADIGAAAASHTHNYLSLSGGTLTGALTLSSGGLTTTTGAHIIKDTRFDRDGSNPSADVWSAVFGFQDKNGESLGYLQAYQLTGGATGLNLYCLAEGTNNTQYNNFIRLTVDKSGKKTYSVGDAAAFRSTIGITTGSSTTSTGTWRWTKLPGGIAIAHYDDSANRSIACTSSSGQIYFGSVSNIAFPFTFSAIPTVSISLSGTGNAWTQASSVTTSGTGIMYFGRGSSSTLSSRLHITVIGTYS